jgi:hypothetical protein
MFPGYGTDKPDDHLPPFVALTNDEERERKATLKSAGTYIVVVNPDSFKSLPSYSTSALTTPAELANFSDDINISDPKIKVEEIAEAEITTDPNIIILKTFEEFPRRPSPHLMSDPTFTNSPLPHFEPLQYSQRRSIENNQGRFAQLMHHYRTKISAHLIKARNQDIEEDIFEIQAHTFPPVRTTI